MFLHTYHNKRKYNLLLVKTLKVQVCQYQRRRTNKVLTALLSKIRNKIDMLPYKESTNNRKEVRTARMTYVLGIYGIYLN